jgi:hypothetical protein
MVKKMLCSLALLGGLMLLFAGLAAAQDYQGPPKPAISDYGPFKNVPFKNPIIKPAPGTCGNPAATCLFYGGDFLFNPLYPNLANGLSNENDLVIAGTPYGAATWVPFRVPAGKGWDVTGLFTNNQSTYGVLDRVTHPDSAAYWSINRHVKSGSGGTTVASGTSAATSTPTGRGAFGLNEYTVQVTGLSVTLNPGSYWMIVVPLCTNTADPYCNGRFFLSDVEYINVTPTNAFGSAEPIDAAFWDTSFFGFTFTPTNGPLGACGGIGCDAFSAGVLGRRR